MSDGSVSTKRDEEIAEILSNARLLVRELRDWISDEQRRHEDTGTLALRLDEFADQFVGVIECYAEFVTVCRSAAAALRGEDEPESFAWSCRGARRLTTTDEEGAS